MNVKHIPWDHILVPDDRLRAVNADKVAQMAFSMKEVIAGFPRGQMVPVEVSPASEEGVYTLISGAHRMAAVKAAEVSETVLAVVYEGSLDPDHLRMREIDENLYRSDLSPYDFATFIAERARLFEKINGQIKQGPRKFRQDDGNSFTAATAKQLGFSDATIDRARKRIKKIASDVWTQLRGTEAAENGTYLDVLRRLPADKQRAVVKEMLAGRPFQTSLDLHVPSASRSKTPQQEADALIGAFRRATPEARSIFRSLLRKEPKVAAAGED